ncbi:SRPBCC family protein [Novosphingobium soli]|uniref:SRPBCC family protein n=1 Tax=Novosphingobium soli TaxID=574956 RepID=UPI0036387F01
MEAAEKRVGRIADLQAIKRRLKSWLVKDQARGIFQIDRAAFTDAELFDIEMKYIFERNWIFLAHESQVAKPHDFLTTKIGRTPVIIITRDRTGTVCGLVNACAHRGAKVCREKAGNKKNFMCPFHGWTYSSAGDLLDVTEEGAGGYAPGFDRADFGLPRIARLEIYRGFIFGSLSPDVLPLEEYLAGSKAFIDLLVDQSQQGEMEVLPGATRYRYRGNWKMQVENGLDGYHVGTVHANYFMTVMRRVEGASKNDTKAIDFSNFNRQDGGSFSFHNGHSVLWADYANFRDRPNFEALDWIEETHGEEKALWMNKRIRNLQLFPNVFLMDQTSTQIRIIQPISVDETEVTTYCIAPVGESASARALRIRQYEDFFNASGMATPDDLTEFNNCQAGFGAGEGRMNDMSRGATRWEKDAGQFGAGLAVDAVMSSPAVADEGLYVAIHDEWISRMNTAIDQETAELIAKGDLELAR